MKHVKFEEARILIDADMPVMLTGEKGSGKTTLARQVAEALELTFFSVSMTRQTTLSHLIGFRTVTGQYSPSPLYRAVTEGGLFLLDEIDAGDPNVLLSLNTLENGYMSFPEGIVDKHEDFRLVATANPQDQHQHYTGRSKLDAATLDRFDIIHIPRDDALEATLVDKDTHTRMTILRTCLAEQNSDRIVSMRDSVRYQKRKNLSLLADFMETLAGGDDLALQRYNNLIAALPKYRDQSECETFSDLVQLIKTF